MPVTRIYEVVNLARRESVLAVTNETPEAFNRRLLPPRAGPLAEWPESEEIFADCIAEDMDLADADEFVSLFLVSGRAAGWKSSLWRP